MPSRLFVTLILTLLDVSTGEAICAVSLADGYGVKAASKHIPNHLIEQGSVRCSVFGVVEVQGQRGIVGLSLLVLQSELSFLQWKRPPAKFHM